VEQDAIGRQAMKMLLDKYLNEIVGLSIMVLMALAIVSAEADADLQRAAVDDVRQVIKVRLTAGDWQEP
jgi:hypothetical protein